MPEDTQNLQRIFRASEGMAPQALVAALSEDPGLAGQLIDEIRRLSILAEAADRVTRQLSLDHQLPQLIELITEAVDAERATLFLHDAEANELFSRVLSGDGLTEIRIPEAAGIVGSVFASGNPEIIADAYDDPRFNAEIDRRTGYRTRAILCVPLRNSTGGVIGVTQVLNKRTGVFQTADLDLVAAISRQAASALEQSLLIERLAQAQREEDELLSIAEAISTELHLDKLFVRIMGETTRLLNAERSTLFVYDPATDELWSQVAEGADQKQIRIPASAGLAGAAFASGEVLNIPDAYADPRFNRTVDIKTGFHTRNMLNVPVIDRLGRHIGVVQVLNKRGGAFTGVDIRRLKAFSAEIAIAIQNAELFSDVLALKNYNESILKSLSNGVITLDQKLAVAKVNEAAQRILGLAEETTLNQPAEAVFGEQNAWVLQSLQYVVQMRTSDYHGDTDYHRADGAVIAINATAAPLLGIDGEPIGSMLVLEDLTREKRVRNTMARYMAREVVDRLLAGGEDVLQGTSHVSTVLFSDIRHFTTLTESMGPRETVTMLNEYFTGMVDVIFAHGGMLDKYMGDALMAIFGAPVTSPTDADNALQVATEMLRALTRFNEPRLARGVEPIEIGIGLATGEVLAGSLGSRQRMEYTVIGDNVNLAARLESANKYYGTTVLISAATAEAVVSHSVLRRLDLIRVKGKLFPTLVYEALSHHTEETFPHLHRVIAEYESGLERYERRDWDGAMSRFGAALDLAPNDRPSQIFIDRCRYYSENPPPDEWDGVWVMESK